MLSIAVRHDTAQELVTRDRERACPACITRDPHEAELHKFLTFWHVYQDSARVCTCCQIPETTSPPHNVLHDLDKAFMDGPPDSGLTRSDSKFLADPASAVVPFCDSVTIRNPASSLASCCVEPFADQVTKHLRQLWGKGVNVPLWS